MASVLKTTPGGPLVSVMVPVYNARVTLPAALDSLLKQTYRPLQIIIVDDASTDGSDSFIRDFALANQTPDFQVDIITHTQNMGSGASRRDAVNIVKGEYIASLDADDIFEPHAIATMVREIGDADILAAEYFEERVGKKNRHIRFDVNECAMLNGIKMDTLRFSLWTKLFRSTLLKENCSFTQGVDCWEDLEQIALIYAGRPRVKFLREALYHYTLDPSAKSLTHSGSEKILEQHLSVAGRITDKFSELGYTEVYTPFLTYLKFIAKVKYLRNRRILRHPFHRLRMWRDTFPEVNDKIGTLNNVPVIYRLMFQLAYDFSRLLS